MRLEVTILTAPNDMASYLSAHCRYTNAQHLTLQKAIDFSVTTASRNAMLDRRHRLVLRPLLVPNANQAHYFLDRKYRARGSDEWISARNLEKCVNALERLVPV
jgi:hypothetical protein